MSWLKLTSEALYLMKGGTDYFLEKLELNDHNAAKTEFKLTVPFHWFKGSGAPKALVIDVDSTQDVKKAPKTNIEPSEIFTKVIKRESWGAKPPTSRFEIVDRPQFIVIHHTDHTTSVSRGTEAGAKELARGIQTFHMTGTDGDKPWSDIGYNFLNTVGGYLVEGRSGSLEQAIFGNSVRGAHAGRADGNRSPGIANEGNFDVNKSMPKEQWDSLVSLCVALCESCDIDPAQIKGHRDFVATDCPGEWLYSQLDQLREEVRQKLLQ